MEEKGSRWCCFSLSLLVPLLLRKKLTCQVLSCLDRSIPYSVLLINNQSALIRLALLYGSHAVVKAWDQRSPRPYTKRESQTCFIFAVVGYWSIGKFPTKIQLEYSKAPCTYCRSRALPSGACSCLVITHWSPIHICEALTRFSSNAKGSSLAGGFFQAMKSYSAFIGCLLCRSLPHILENLFIILRNF